MDTEKEQLKQLIIGSHKNHDITYQHCFRNGENCVFSIASKTNDVYMYIDAMNGETSVRAYYKLRDTQSEKSIVVQLSEVRDDHCVVTIKALDNLKFRVDTHATTGEINVCPL